MPYKNIKDQRSALKRWRVKNKIKHYAVKIAQKAFPVLQICEINKCEKIGERHHDDYNKPKDIRWLCKKHHEEYHHSKYKSCTVKDCLRKHLAKGLCHHHYYEGKRPWEI